MYIKHHVKQIFVVDDLLIAGAAAAASAYGANQMAGASTANATAANQNNLGMFREGNQFNQAEADKARWFSAEQAQRGRDYQTEMSNTAHQRAVADLKQAGLNPMLAVTQGGASSNGAAIGSSSAASSGSAPRSEVPTPQNVLGAGANSGFAAMRATQELNNMQKQGELLDAQKEKTLSEVPINKQVELKTAQEAKFLKDSFDERIRGVNWDTENKQRAGRILDINEGVAYAERELRKGKIDIQTYTTRIEKANAELTELDIPGAKNEAFYQKHGGQIEPYTRAIGGIINGAGAASRLRRPSRNHNETYYDRHGNETGGRSVNYND